MQSLGTMGVKILIFLLFTLSVVAGQTGNFQRFQDRMPRKIQASETERSETEFLLRNGQLEKTYHINGIAEDWSLVPDFGLVPADDRAAAITTDQNNNIYMIGSSTAAGFGLDISLIKYDAAGKQLWAAVYDSPAGLDDKPVNVFIGSDGAVYVAGKSFTRYNQSIALLLKYDTEGHLLWDKQYDHLGDDLIHAEMNNDHFIAFGAECQNGLQTSRLDTSGQVIWSNLYESEGTLGNYYHTLVTDTAGYIYLNGLIRTGNEHPVTVVLKYDQNGQLIWNTLFNEDDAGYCNFGNLVVDKKGFTVVCGMDKNADKMVLTKIDSSGSLVWSAVYSDPFLNYVHGQKAILDNQGFAYALGTCKTHFNRTNVLVKYDTAGCQLWVVLFDDTYENQFYIAASDTGGAVYTAGYIVKDKALLALKKFNTEGQEVWSDEYLKSGYNSGYLSAVLLARDGSLTACGTSTADETGRDMALLRYDNSGSLEWDAYYNHGVSKSNSSSGKLAAAKDGSVYLLGYNPTQFRLFKYTNNGQTVWAKVYPETPATDVYSRSVEYSRELDAVYVWAQISSTNMLFSYKASGVLAWSQTVPSLSSMKMSRINAKGAVSFSGTYYDTESDKEAVRTSCYDKNGNLSWSTVYLPKEKGYLDIEDIKIKSDGTVYVLFEDWKEQSNFSQYRLNAYDKNGMEMWSRLVIEPISSYFKELILDEWDNVFTVGRVYDTLSHRAHYELKKVNKSGSIDWTAVYSHPDLSVRGEYITAVDIFGNIYLASSSWNYALNSYTYFIVKWDRYGQLLWDKFIDESLGSFFPNLLETDQLGNLYVCGSDNTSEDAIDVTVVKFDTDGSFKWQVISGAGLNGWDWFKDIAVNSRGDVFVTASSGTASMAQHFISLFKYGQSGPDSMEYVLPEQFSLEQNAPNPFNNQTLLRFSVKREIAVKISVFNTAGQRVYFKNLGNLQQGNHILHFNGTHLASGVYYYRVKAGNSLKTKKMVLVH